MKRKESNKKQRGLLLLILLLVISIGYALIATTLKINGTSQVKGTRWDVYWDNVQIKTGSVETTETNKARITDQSRTIVQYTVELSEPGDFYEFTVDAVNDGSLDAMVDEVVNNGLKTGQNEYIEYSVKYLDGTSVNKYDKLTANTRDTYVVRLAYKTDADPTKLPDDNQVLDLTFEVKYVQADNRAKVRPRSCNGYLYAEGNITKENYNTICEDYIDESIFTYTTNSDNTLTLTGLTDDAVLPEDVFVLPATIGGKTVTKVSGDAFNNKITSKSLVIAPTITTIEDGTADDSAFSNNNSIAEVSIPNSVTYIGNSSFMNDTKLSFVNVGEGVTTISPGTFANCTSLKKVILNDNITSIGSGAFSSTGLTSIKFPKKLTTISGGSFANTKLEKIEIPDTITTVQSGAFNGAQPKEYKTGNGLTSLEYGIIGHENLEKFVIGDGITVIPQGYFSTMGGSPKLSEVVIGKNVTTINQEAFKTANLTTLTIPKRVTSIGEKAIYKTDTSNSNLTKIINKTGKEFDWGLIVFGESGEPFETGTLENTTYGNVVITAE